MNLNRSLLSRARAVLRLEQLEERMVPASILFSGGNLSISTPTHVNSLGQTILLVTQDPATGLFTVTDGGAFQGNYNVTGNLTITGSNRADAIGVFIDKGSLRGNLTIYGLNGNDTIAVDGNTTTGTIRGNLYVDGGLGDDQMSVGNGSGINILGKNNTVIGNYGNDSLVLGNGSNKSIVAGDLSVYSTQNVIYSKTDILGSQLLTTQLAPTTTAKKFAPLNVSFTGVNRGLATNPGPVTIVGSNLGDTLLFDANTTLGNTVITEGTGANTLTLDATVKGNFNYRATDGDNTITINGTAAVHQGSTTLLGDLTLTLGDGNNKYKLDTGFRVDNNFTLNNGNGDLTADIGATVGHFLSVNTGLGTNAVTLLGDSSSVTTTFGQFFYSFGGGSLQNTVTFNNDSSQPIIANVIVPALPGNYLLDIVFLGKNNASNPGVPSPLNPVVNLSGGTSSPNASFGTIHIFDNSDTVTLNNTLPPTISVTQFP